MKDLTELLPSLALGSESEDTDVVHVPMGVLRRGIEELIALRRWCEPMHPFAAGVMIATARLWAGRWKRFAKRLSGDLDGAMRCVGDLNDGLLEQERELRALRIAVAALTETNDNQRRTIEALRADVDGPQ